MRTLLYGVFAVLVVGCSSGATVSVRVAQSGNALTVSNGVEISRVRMIVRQIELERGDDQDEQEFEAGPYLIDISGAELDAGGVAAQFSTNAAAGTYEELEFEVHPLEGDLPDDPAMRDMFTRGASVVIEGSYNGNAFVYESALTEKKELDGAFDIKGDGSDNLTLQLDPSGWFLSEGGATLDPADPDSKSQVEANIKSSIDAYDDDDEDGDDDDLESQG